MLPGYFISARVRSLGAWTKFAVMFGALLATAQAQSGSYDFNSGQSNFDSTFTSNGGAGGGIATIAGTGGIGGTGSLSTNGVTNHSIVFNTPLANSTGAVITASFFFQTKSTVDTNDLTGLALLGSTTQLLDAGNNLFYKVNGSNSSSLLTSTWYRLVATITNTGSTFHTVLTLESYGASGTTASGSLTTLPTSDSTGGTLLTTSSVYVGIYGGGGILGGFPQNYQTPAIDNFAVSAIPEPATYAGIIGCFALAGAGWYRRRRGHPV